MSTLDLIKDHTFTVSEASELINGVLAPLRLTIEGEVSSFKVNQGKWIYFDIKDDQALLSCFMVRYQLPFDLEPGMHVKISAYPKIYAKYGRLSLTVSSVEIVGEGALQKAFEELKKKLEAEGVFDQQWKKTLPLFPKTIGIVTSREADALQDIGRILKNRAGGLNIILAPVAVQGQLAVGSITAALRYFNQYKPVDVIIVARGGGSLEDLQAFNAEPVVRAIFASNIPIITGVGHEPDITLADLVADVRAATPTNAAEIVVPDYDILQSELVATHRRLVLLFNRVLQRWEQPVMQMHHRMRQSILVHFRQTDQLIDRLKTSADRIIATHDQRLALLENSLYNLDPTHVLKRGFAIIKNEQGKVISSIKDIKTDDMLTADVSDGSIDSRVIKTVKRSKSG